MMKTIIKNINRENIDSSVITQAGEILKQGGLVAIPTETVYGLGANALDEEAAKKTYAAKGRPSDNPLIVHIADMKDLEKITDEIPEATYRIAEKFWPGPLTLIFKKSEIVPYGTTGGLETVAVRMPSDEVAQRIIRAGGGYVSAPSANTSGRPSPTKAEHVVEDMEGKIDMIVDGGAVDIGVESSILDMTVQPPMILRPGAITKEMLEEVIGEVAVDQVLLDPESKVAPKAPGMKYRHYAPKAELVVIEGESDQVIHYINEQAQAWMADGKRVGVIGTDETVSSYDATVIKAIGSRNDANTVAAGLFSVLREFDEEQVDIIFSEAFQRDGIGSAIMNRLLKAAGQKVIQL